MLSRRDLEIAEKSLGPAHPNVSAPLIGLATVLVQQHNYNDAELFVRRALSIDEASFGPEHPNVAEDLVALAKVLREQGRYSEAEPALQRALAIDVKMLPRDSFEAANDHNELALLAQAQKDWSRAAAHWQLAVEILQRRLARASRLDSRLSNRREPEVNKHYFDNLIKATYRLQSASPEDTRRQAGAMFEVAQWGLASNAGNAVALMAARSTAGGSELGSLVRERQDLVAEWQAKDRLLVAAKGNAPKERDLASEKVLTDRLTAIDARLTDVDAHIAADFPNYSAFANPRPSSIQEVQAELRSDEELVLFVDTPPENPAPEETFIWVVTRNDAQFMRSALGTSALKREVSALRCGLDYAGAWLAKGSRCRDLTGVDYTDADDRASKPLPFDAGRAHKVYSALLGQAKDLIAGKHLLVVASGALTQLPLHVLVTDAPEVSKPNEIAWLARSHAITVLPAVSSLVSLRRNAKASGARQPYLGIGNPLFDGAGPHDAEKKAAALANAECGALHALEVAGVRGISGRQPPQRDGIADVASLRTAAPLPETAAEVCDVARAAGGDLGDVRLGARSTEAEVKRLDEAGALRDFRIVHFATHGAMAGEVTGAAEPGLLLTPPASGSDRDDGYLSASEIAALKFDAEWVLLSACNTAAGGADGGEALSGVAGAFFYAGARSLLVSHWYVESDATVALVAGTFAEMKERPHNGRAEAMRRSMLALIDEGLPPASWAPFVIVGEGGAER
jgi:CHAT domain-containing protein/tetratricopeptide (TPR) repeat protein